ncbi:MAG: hypothetical protein OXF64_06595, partial [bacterium]|nr:hypothetical protein [bacterium]
MTKTKLIFIGLALALVGFLFAGSASAQDGPSLSASPSSLAEPGEATVTVTGSGWTVGSAFLLPCNIPEGVNAAELDDAAVANHCSQTGGFLDMGNLTPVTIADGDFEATVTVNVPAQGIFLVTGDATGQESAFALVSVGTDDMMDDDMLAETGVETSVLVIIGAGIALAGVMVFGLSRRLR